MAGYGLNRGAVRVIGCFWVYAGILEYLQHFSPGRNPELVDFAASAIGALCGGVAVFLPWRWRTARHCVAVFGCGRRRLMAAAHRSRLAWARLPCLLRQPP
jgi:hypothetical protein